LALDQQILLDDGERNPLIAQHRDQRIEMRARPHEHGNVLGALRDRRAHVANDRPGLGLASAAMSIDARKPCSASHAATDAVNATLPRQGSLCGTEHGGEDPFVHSTRRACDRKLRRRPGSRPKARRSGAAAAPRRRAGPRRRGTDRSIASGRRRRTACAHRRVASRRSIAGSARSA
jgi:hypothetical protein